MPRSRRWRPLGLLVLVLVVAAGAWVSWSAWRVSESLSSAAEDASALQDAVAAGDSARAEGLVTSLQEHSAEATDRSSGWTWDVLGRLPFVGDDAEAVAVVSRVLDDLSRNGLPPAVELLDSLAGLAPRDGQVDLAAIEGLQAPVSATRDALRRAADQIGRVDQNGLVGPLERRFTDLRARLEDARAAAEAASTAAEVVPPMLGASGPTEHLLVFQNNAELRSTGGLPGALSVLRAEDGRLSLTQQATGGSLPPVSRPIVPLRGDERQIFPGLGFLAVNSNTTPDYPRAAEVLRGFWESNHEGRLDGVIAVDPVGLSYLLGATGPVTVDGIELSAETAVDELLHGTYVRLADPEAQDAFFQRAAALIFEALTSGGGSPVEIVRALARATDEGRLLVHSFDDGVQAELANTSVSGALITDPDVTHPQVGVYLQDSTGSKMSYFLRYDVDVDATSCPSGRQRLTGRMDLRSTATPDVADLPVSVTGGGLYGTDPGSQLIRVRLVGPAAGDISDFRIDGEPVEPEIFDLEGRKVASLIALLEPEQRSRLTWRMSAGPGQTDDVDVSVTPGVEPGDPSSTVPTACG